MSRKETRDLLFFAVLVLGLSAVLSLCFYFFSHFLSQVPEDSWRGAGYVGIFVLSFAGASSVLIPIPYTVVLLGIAPYFNPLGLAAAVGLGSASGELVGYGIGYVGGWVLGEKRRRQSDAMLRIFKRYGVPVIFIFALTPLPDDLLFIPLGLMHYSLWKAFAACVAGKFFMALVIASAGKVTGAAFAIEWPFALAMTVLLALVVVAVFRVDWVKLAERYATKRARSGP